ncbi:MAG: hypothetical protein GY882_01610 [Actinomycetia bacterium]|nr:hypothetical protein [Actinomycetes bacterium]MCP4844866.1 hypothetical protein [Actinomycetes bacterium]
MEDGTDVTAHGLELLAAHSVADLERFVASPPRGPLVIVEAPSDEVAVAASRMIANALVGDSVIEDYTVVEPQGASWSVDDVRESICAPVTLTPVRMHVVTIVGADRMAPAAADKLLKTVEEPAAPSLLLACCTNRMRLQDTIRGRASRTLELTARTPDSIVESLAALHPTNERLLADCAGLATTDPGLLMAAAGDEVLLEVLRRAVHADLESSPATTAAAAAADIDEVAAAVTAPTPAAAKRRVADAVLGAWAVRAAERSHGDPAAIRWAEGFIARVDDARAMLARGARPAHAISAVLCD